MRHLLSSFLALHWAVLFALLAFVCTTGTGALENALASFGATHADPQSLHLDGMLMTAPLAAAFLVVAAVFCWALIETFLGKDAGSTETISKIGFVAAGGVSLLVLVCGTAQGIEGLFLPSAAHLAALAASYLAVVGERLTAPQPKVIPIPSSRTTIHAMARGAAHASLLSRISGRPDSGAQS
jgi:predicted secreted protein